MIGLQAGQGGGSGPEPEVDEALRWLVRADQLANLKRGAAISVPASSGVAFLTMLVAIAAGRALEGAVWFAAGLLLNVGRYWQMRRFREIACGEPVGAADAAEIDRQRHCLVRGAFASGIVWACVPWFSGELTSDHTLFYLTAICGVTAGAVPHGIADWRVPWAFLVPPLLSVIAWLVFSTPSFDRTMLALSVAAYTVVLAKSAVVGQGIFGRASLLRFEATALSLRLREATRDAIRLADEMAERAHRDSLTGLPNRAGFLREAERIVAEGRGCHLMMIDLDGFKSINDAFGHEAGDRVLIEVAGRLARTMPPFATVARLGGDEFAACWPSPRRAQAPQALAAEVIAAVGRPFGWLEGGVVGASVGLHQGRDEPLDAMLTHADSALYAAKAGGRNRCCAFDERLRAQLDMRLDIERDLARALAESEVEIWFQPIFGRTGDRLASFEALLRWKHPRHGWIPPPEIVTVAALGGRAERLLRYVLDGACRLLATLDRVGRSDVGVAINVSPREMAQIAVDEIVVARLQDLGIRPERLEIEITEETALDMDGVRRRLAALRAAGIRLAVDDFGVGFSSLATLRHLRPHRVKIDRCFVTGIGRSPEDRALVAAVLGLGRAMSFEVVAEGVETAEDLGALRDAGCPFVQGYHLGRPMPPAAVAAWLGRDMAEAS